MKPAYAIFIFLLLLPLSFFLNMDAESQVIIENQVLGEGFSTAVRQPVFFTATTNTAFTVIATDTLLVNYTSGTFEKGRFWVDSSGNVYASGTLNTTGGCTNCGGGAGGNNFFSATSSFVRALTVTDGVTTSSLRADGLFVATSTNNNLGLFQVDSSGGVYSSGTYNALAGSAAAPSYTFTTDTDTGIRRSAANTLSLVSGGTDAITVLYNGLTTLEMSAAGGFGHKINWSGNGNYLSDSGLNLTSAGHFVRSDRFWSITTADDFSFMNPTGVTTAFTLNSATGLLTWPVTGGAMTAGSYQFGRDNTATNILTANVPSGASFQWKNNDVQQMNLNSSGYLGINTTTASSTLSVQGNGMFSGNLTLANLTATGTLGVTGNTTLQNLTVNGTCSGCTGSGAAADWFNTTQGGFITPSTSKGLAIGTSTLFAGGMFAVSSTNGDISTSGSLYINGASHNLRDITDPVNLIGYDNDIGGGLTFVSNRGNKYIAFMGGGLNKLQLIPTGNAYNMQFLQSGSKITMEGGITSLSDSVLTVAGTANITSLSTLTGGFISQASSSISARLQLSGTVNVSSSLYVGGRFLGAKGATVASAASVTLGTDGNYFEISGTTGIDCISKEGWTPGSRVYIEFQGVLTMRHNQACTLPFLPIYTIGAINVDTAASNTMDFMLGTQGWYMGTKLIHNS